MPIPSSKEELLEALQTGYDKLEKELKTVPVNLSRKKELEGNVSICDIIAYQIGWTELLIGWYKSGKKNKTPDLPAKDFKWNQLGDLAKHFYKTFEKDSFDSLLRRFKKAKNSVEEIINENTTGELYTLNTYNWTGDKWTLGRWINVNTSSPYKSARAKIRKWKN